MGRRKPTLTVLFSLCVLTSLLALPGTTASAAVTHEYLSHITEVPAGPGVALPGHMVEVEAMTVDAGKLYVGENNGEGAYRTDEFDAATGAFLMQFPQIPSLTETGRHGMAAGHATGEEQVYAGAFSEGSRVVGVLDDEGHLLGKWSGSDTPGGAFVEVTSIGADNSSNLNDWAAGDVYVADPSARAVDVFKPKAGGTEEYVAQLEPEVPFQEPWYVAVDQLNGDVVVIDNRNVVDVFEPTVFGKYALIHQLTGTPAGPFQLINSLAVDGSNGDIYVAEGESGIVYQFSEIGQYLGRLTGTPTTAFRSVRSLAVDPAVPHHVYVGDDRETEPSAVDVFGPNIVIPDVATGPATEVKTIGEGQIEARLNGTVNPDKEGEASCQFVWGSTREFGQTASCEPEEVANGENPLAVHATLRGAGLLASDTTYYYRLQATNKNGTNPGEAGQDQEFTTPGPGIRAEAVSAVRAESVTFDAKLNPHGAPTSYYFQYGTSSSYGSDVPALGAGDTQGTGIGSGEGDVEVDQHVQTLSGGTVYHYRVVAVSELAPGKLEYFYGADQRFTTQTAGVTPQLPDGREWEMVSPPQKEGVLLGWIYDALVQASSKGDAITDWTSFEPTEDHAAGAYGFRVSTLFGRGADGWTAKTIAPPHSGAGPSPVGTGSEYHFFSEDLSKSILQPFGPFTPLAPGVSEATPYLRTDFLSGHAGELCTTDCYQPLVSAANVPSGTQFGEEPGGNCEKIFCGPDFLGGTPNLNHVVLESQVALSPTSLEGDNGLYEWGGGKLQLVNVLPQRESEERGGPVGAEAHLGGTHGGAMHAISDDGSRIIWLGNGASQHTHLYLRDTVKDETIRLDVFQGVEKGPEANYVIDYATASSDGSRIFFLDGERLTADSTANKQQPDLYEYDLDAPAGSRLTDLSVSAKLQEPANVAAVQGVSDDGSYVYFAAPGALAPGASAGRCESQPQPGETQLCNLYVRHAGKTTFIAGLSQDDHHDWSRFLEELPARVSPDGRWFAFMSDRDLTGYDTTDAVSKRPDEEVYLYDAVRDKLTCASCNPDGSRPIGVKYADGQLVGAIGLFEGEQWVASNVPPWTRSGGNAPPHQSRYLSDSGRLFFDSHDALVSQDVNGAQDVYEYEPVGVGDCSLSSATFSESSGGCVAPMSSGTSNEESAFLDASEDGDHVFFLTAAKLASQDFDNQLDIYDAHACTASDPCFAPEQVAPPACDTGESCKPAQSQQPTLFGSPSSATFSGVGNVAQPASGKASPKSLTRGQKLRRALRTCRREKKHRRRMACERSAKHRYGAKAASRAASSTHDLSGRTGR